MKHSIFDHPGVRIATSTRNDGTMKKNKQFVDENIQKFMSEHSFKGEVVTLQQTHGTNVADVSHGGFETPIPETDAALSDTSQYILSVVTADCLPITFFDPEKKAVAIAHAGYKGIYNNIILYVVMKMVQKGSKPENILVGIGPSIGVCSYNVDSERAESFSEKFGKEAVIYRSGTPYLDLKKIARMQLLEQRIPEENISDQDICTECNKDQYFSFRGDSNETFGECITLIQLA